MRDRHASYGNQIISSTRPNCWIQISTVMRDKHCGRPSDVRTLTGELSWQRLRPSAVNFYSKKTKKNRSLIHRLAHLRVTYVLHLWLVGKPVVDFIFVVVELLSLSPTVETLWAEIGRSRRFSKGVGHFHRRFQSEWGIAHQSLLASE